MGVTERWWLKPLAAPLLHMPVPASYNDITQGAHTTTMTWQGSQQQRFYSLTPPTTDNELRRHIGWVWYERDFFVPRTWVSTGQRIVLRFESVSYAASVWVDGTAVRPPLTMHDERPVGGSLLHDLGRQPRWRPSPF